MSQQLINHSPDLKRLRDEGFEIEVRDGHLLVHHIPYLNNRKESNLGVLVTTLTLSDSLHTTTPNTHVIHFIGENPCEVDGSIITSIQHSEGNQVLSNNIIVDRSFSNKPKDSYPNYYEKVKRYADLISAPAKHLDNSLTEKTFKVIEDSKNETVFQYIDTNSSRASIMAINSKLEQQKIAIIGLGGTGGYILDLVAKTPVKEIHLFDGDSFDQHNAFRSPGAASIDDLATKPRKVNYFSTSYSNIHKHIFPNDCYLNKENLQKLDEMDYVFVCVDRNSVRKLIHDHLVYKGVSFIDVGLGVKVTQNNQLSATLRVTSASREVNEHLPKRVFIADSEEDEYSTNIQIAELNSFNAVLAVLKWKKWSGVYSDQQNEHHSTCFIDLLTIINEDCTTQIC